MGSPKSGAVEARFQIKDKYPSNTVPIFFNGVFSETHAFVSSINTFSAC